MGGKLLRRQWPRLMGCPLRCPGGLNFANYLSLASVPALA
jgi:hypothetical protein